MRQLETTPALLFDMEGFLDDQCSVEGYISKRNENERDHPANGVEGIPLALRVGEAEIVFARRILTLMWQLQKDQDITIDRDWRKNVTVDNLKRLFHVTDYCEDSYVHCVHCTCASLAPLWPCSTYPSPLSPSPPPHLRSRSLLLHSSASSRASPSPPPRPLAPSIFASPGFLRHL